MTPNISELVERLEGAEAGDRKLDTAIANLLDTADTPHVTTSLDAALALAERVVGDGWLWTSGAVIGGSKAFGVLTRLGESSSIKGNGATPALALCIATLKALAAMDGSRPAQEPVVPTEPVSTPVVAGERT